VSQWPLPNAMYGYASQFSVPAGGALTFHVSGEGVDVYNAALVRLRHGIERGPGFRETEVPSPIDGRYKAEHHPSRCGSYVHVPDAGGVLMGDRSLTIALSLYATLPESTIQGVIGQWDSHKRNGYALVICDGRLALWLGDGQTHTEIGLGQPLLAHTWYSIAAGYDLDSGTAWIEQVPARSRADRVSPGASRAQAGRAEGATQIRAVTTQAPFRMAALSYLDRGSWVTKDHFNGKLGNPTLSEGDGTVLASWDFAASDHEDGSLRITVVETSGIGLNGECVNTPQRGVSGSDWDGVAEDYRLSPASYGAIHFHDDDLDDSRWPIAFELNVPRETPSGVYAIRLRADDVSDEHIPFIVRPGDHQQRAAVALLLPTGSYLAYANDRLPFDAAGAELLAGHVPVLHLDDLQLQQHYDFGHSCYEVHSDGSGVVFSSRRRPIVTMRPRYYGWFMGEGPWQFSADLCIVDWLDELGVEYDVICDEDLHRDGLDLLEHYRVVLTGSHPEYVSVQEMDALETYVRGTGRVMYLGGNGFYWLVSYDPDKPHLMEVRRSENGSRPHSAWPGEQHHQTTGEKCGMWRSKRRAPQRLFGVGMGSEGFDQSSGYQRMPDSYDPAAQFIFEGVEDTYFGNFGLMGGGAAGAELDRYDVELGSPPTALLVASSVGLHSDDYQQASEDLLETPPTTGGTQGVAVRSDVVYIPLTGGGAIFSVGSIAWTGALSHNNYQNSISTITRNVLKQFLSENDPPGGRVFPLATNEAGMNYAVG
jgi:N,N-dimethylformamidase